LCNDPIEHMLADPLTKGFGSYSVSGAYDSYEVIRVFCSIKLVGVMCLVYIVRIFLCCHLRAFVLTMVLML
jgi:hypothetical protein